MGATIGTPFQVQVNQGSMRGIMKFTPKDGSFANGAVVDTGISSQENLTGAMGGEASTFSYAISYEYKPNGFFGVLRTPPDYSTTLDPISCPANGFYVPNYGAVGNIQGSDIFSGKAKIKFDGTLLTLEQSVLVTDFIKAAEQSCTKVYSSDPYYGR